MDNLPFSLNLKKKKNFDAETQNLQMFLRETCREHSAYNISNSLGLPNDDDAFHTLQIHTSVDLTVLFYTHLVDTILLGGFVCFFYPCLMCVVD